MAQVKSDPITIAARIVARIIDEVSNATSDNCYVSLDPDDLPPSPADFVYIVSPRNGKFDVGMFVGGGPEQATVESVLVVTIHNIAQNDERGRDLEFLRHTDRGLVPKATEVIKALAGHDLRDESDDAITIEPLHVLDFDIQRGESNKSRKYGSIQIGFQCTFDWNLE